VLFRKHLDILLADSDMEAVEQFVCLLEEWGFPVTQVSSGQEAYARLSALQRPTLALLGMNLPEMSAPTILHKMRGTLARRRFSAILLTSDARSDTVRSALDAGADDLLPKPCDSFELRVRIAVAERLLTLSSDLAHSQSAASYNATHDPLTGIWNRETFLSMFFRETDRIQRSQEPLALMLLDLDGLEAVKKEHGILAWEYVLKQVVARLQRFLRSYDILGRYGDNEFLLALPGLRTQDMEKLLERIRRSIFAKPFRIQHAEVRLSANFGLAQSKGYSPLIVLSEAERELALAHMQRRTPLVRENNQLRQPVEDEERFRPGLRSDRVH